MPGNELLEKVQKFDKDANGIDLQEFADGIKKLTETEYKDLGAELTEKDQDVLKLLETPLAKAKEAYEGNSELDIKIVNFLILAGKIEMPQIHDSGYIDNIKTLIGNDAAKIKELLNTNMKHMNLVEITQENIENINIDENGIYIPWTDKGVDKNNYILPIKDLGKDSDIRKNREYVVSNIKLLMIDYINYFDKDTRSETSSLQKMEQNIKDEKVAIECAKKLIKQKDAFVKGTMDMSEYSIKYGTEKLGKALKYLLSTLQKEGKDVNVIYANWKIGDPKTESSKTFQYIQECVEKNGSSESESIYSSLYFGTIQYKLKDYLYTSSPTGIKYFIEPVVRSGGTANPDQLNDICLSTVYGKQLREQSIAYWNNLDIKDDIPLIQEFEKKMAKMERDMRRAYDNYVRVRDGAGSTPKQIGTAEALYLRTQKEYKYEGNYAFLKMILQVKGYQSHTAEMQSHISNFIHQKTVDAPIGGGGFKLDFSKYNKNSTLDDNINNIMRDKAGERITDRWNQTVSDITTNPTKFIIEIASIIGGGLAATAVSALTEGGGMVLAGVTFTTVSNLIKGIGYKTFDVGGGSAGAVGLADERGVDNEKKWTTFLTEQAFSYGSGIVLMGPIGKAGAAVESSVLESMMAKSVGVTNKVISKSIGLLAEAGVFTGYGIVTNPLQEAALTGQNYFDLLNKAMDPVNILTGFIYNVGFIGALKIGGALSHPLTKGLLNKTNELKYNSLVDEFKEKSTAFGEKCKELGVTTQQNGETIRFLDKTNTEITDFRGTYKPLADLNAEMLQTQAQILQITSTLKEFAAIPEVASYNEYCKTYDLISQTISPEMVAKRRIEYYSKKGNTVEVARRTKIVEDLATLKGSYDKQVVAFQKKGSVSEETQTIIDPNIVKKNSLLSPEARIIKAKELPGLKDITQAQEKAILDAHNLPGELFNLNFGETRAKMEKLLEANFSKEQIRVLMDNGICGTDSKRGDALKPDLLDPQKTALPDNAFAQAPARREGFLRVSKENLQEGDLIVPVGEKNNTRKYANKFKEIYKDDVQNIHTMNGIVLENGDIMLVILHNTKLVTRISVTKEAFFEIFTDKTTFIKKQNEALKDIDVPSGETPNNTGWGISKTIDVIGRDVNVEKFPGVRETENTNIGTGLTASDHFRDGFEMKNGKLSANSTYGNAKEWIDKFTEYGYFIDQLTKISFVTEGENGATGVLVKNGDSYTMYIEKGGKFYTREFKSVEEFFDNIDTQNTKLVITNTLSSRVNVSQKIKMTPETFVDVEGEKGTEKINYNEDIITYTNKNNRVIVGKILGEGEVAGVYIIEPLSGWEGIAPGMKYAITKEGLRKGNFRKITELEANNLRANKIVNETQTTIDSTIVKANSLNSDKLIIDGKINLEAKNNIEQILREGKVLGEKEALTDEQIRRIYEAHNLPGELYNLSFGETRAKVDVLKKAEFTSEQIRVLMENGICGMRVKYKETTDGITKMCGDLVTIENCNACMVSIGKRELEVLKVSENLDVQALVPGMRFSTPYVIIDRALYTSSGGSKGYKGLRMDEEVILGRKNQNERFDFGSDNTISGTHVKISYKDGKIIVEDLFSLNGTTVTSKNLIVNEKIDVSSQNNSIKGLQEQIDIYETNKVDKMVIQDVKDIFADEVKDIISKYPNTEDVLIDAVIKDGKNIYKALTGKEWSSIEVNKLLLLNELTSEILSQTQKMTPGEYLQIQKQNKKNEGNKENIVPEEKIVALDNTKENASSEEEKIVYLDENNMVPEEKIVALDNTIVPEEIVPLDGKTDYLDFSKLEYVSEGGGSNGGKWYKSIESGKEYFVKSYENIDQSKTEFVTNLIYQELGLGAPKSYVVISDKGVALATEKVTGKEAIDNINGINNGFVVDCWLANRDGTKPGNLLQGADGIIYRIDNGGSLFFRARGKNKNSFSNEEVTELASLRDKNLNRFSYKHFGAITDKEIITQVKELKTKMTDEKIKELVYKGDISNKDEVVEVLIKRRDWLVKNYDINLSVKPEVKEIVYSEYDKETLEKIANGESLLGRLPTLKWTHRTDFATLKLILESGCIGTNKSRGNNFWGGLGAGYGDVTLIMKSNIENLPAASDVPGTTVKGKENMTYFWENNAQGMGMDLETFSSNFGDFSKIRNSKGDNPHINAPYLMLGGQDGGTAFKNTVSVSSVEAIMLPAHIKNDANYTLIKAKIENLGIKIIETPTTESILEYAGGSIINANNPNRGDYGIQIQNELKILYPSSSFQEASVKYLKDNGIIDANSTKSFYEIQNDYNTIASDAGLSRYNLNSSGQFENYVSAKNFTLEQKAYFTYLIQSKYDK